MKGRGGDQWLNRKGGKGSSINEMEQKRSGVDANLTRH